MHIKPLLKTINYFLFSIFLASTICAQCEKKYDSKYTVILKTGGEALLTENIKFREPIHTIEIKIAKNADINTLLINTKKASIKYYSVNGTRLTIEFSKPVTTCDILYKANLPWHVNYKGIISNNGKKVRLEARVILMNKTELNFKRGDFYIHLPNKSKLELQKNLNVSKGQILNVLLCESDHNLVVERRICLGGNLLEEKIDKPIDIKTLLWGIIPKSKLKLLPNGKLILYQYNEEFGRLSYIGESLIKINPQQLEQSFKIPNNVNFVTPVSIKAIIEQTEFKKLRHNKYEAAFYVVLKNKTKKAETIRAVIDFPTERWRLVRKSIDPIQQTNKRLAWTLRVQAGAPTSYRYRVQYKLTK